MKKDIYNKLLTANDVVGKASMVLTATSILAGLAIRFSKTDSEETEKDSKKKKGGNSK